VRGGGSCSRCRRTDDEARGSAVARGYDRRWSDYARDWLVRFPWCGQRQDGALHADHSRCVQRGERQRAQLVDHIMPLRAGGAKLDPHNHQSLCRGCNRVKANVVDPPLIRAFVRGLGPD
jgi:5-methylcytosine-specific restriction endonuclease McrA